MSEDEISLTPQRLDAEGPDTEMERRYAREMMRLLGETYANYLVHQRYDGDVGEKLDLVLMYMRGAATGGLPDEPFCEFSPVLTERLQRLPTHAELGLLAEAFWQRLRRELFRFDFRCEEGRVIASVNDVDVADTHEGHLIDIHDPPRKVAGCLDVSSAPEPPF